MTETEQNAMRAVLGAMLANPDALVLALADLRPDAMTGPEALVLAAVRRLAEKNANVGLVTVCQELERTGELVAVGGSAFVSSLFDFACPMVNLEAVCRVVNGEALRRGLKSACLETLDTLDADEPLEAVDRAEHRIRAIRDAVERNEAEPLAVIIDRLFNTPPSGVKIGFRKIDWATGGLAPGQLVTLGARPGVGKTSLATAIAHRIAARGERVVFFSLEMATSEIAERLVGCEGIPLAQVNRDNAQAIQAGLRASKLPITLLHPTQPTIVDLRASLRRLGPLAIAIVDYLQLIHPGRRMESRAEAVDFVTLGLKQIAREFKIPVLALAQLNRAIEERGKFRPPVLSDLRESGGIENHSDIVAFLHREKYYDPADNSAEFILAKHRQGPVCLSKIEFVRDQATFRDLPWSAQNSSDSSPGSAAISEPDMGF